MKSRISNKNSGALCDTERRCFLRIYFYIYLNIIDLLIR
ncbi:hypothetical protein BACCAP_01907 [Pseudoflavonifractor capillosus ATCC 29799]|uniref:Uncharacterized protein n=1 Tax=Pseudoflavonifractor capillosus ATCC 29799 TaxID=411467 RepID=A6NUM5_9FIRM|nr:hypothetical protein BACCAP_01907 [Pseudoflavonifractor capillosus ATCC 29799]